MSNLKQKMSNKLSTLTRREGQLSRRSSISSVMVEESMPKAPIQSNENGDIHEELAMLAMPGFLSVKELNSELLKYIGQVQDLEIKKDAIIQERDLSIAGQKAEIAKLQTNLSILQNQKEIDEHQIKRLQSEFSYLTGELNAMTTNFTTEQNRSIDLGTRLAAMEQEMRLKIERLGSELKNEMEKTKIDITSLDTRQKGEFTERLKEELKKLREIYEEHMKVSEETLESNYKKKISDLEMSLAIQMECVKPTEDITELKINLEKYRLKIEELDANNRDMSMQRSKLAVELRDKEASFNTRMSAKEIELTYLAKQNEEYKKMYDELRSKVLHEASEVKVYNRLIAPEMDRINRYSKQRHGNTLKLTQTNDAEKDRRSSSNSNEASKMSKINDTE